MNERNNKPITPDATPMRGARSGKTGRELSRRDLVRYVAPASAIATVAWMTNARLSDYYPKPNNNESVDYYESRIGQNETLKILSGELSEIIRQIHDGGKIPSSDEVRAIVEETLGDKVGIQQGIDPENPDKTYDRYEDGALAEAMIESSRQQLVAKGDNGQPIGNEVYQARSRAIISTLLVLLNQAPSQTGELRSMAEGYYNLMNSTDTAMLSRFADYNRQTLEMLVKERRADPDLNILWLDSKSG